MSDSTSRLKVDHPPLISTTVAHTYENNSIMASNEGEEEEETSRNMASVITPLPKLQIGLILLSQSAEPVTATVIYPFINKLIREIGITHGDNRKTGYYAGMIESLFFVSELLTAIFWARQSDRYGRKPILIIGLLGLALSMLAFGMSTKFWMLVLSRFSQGSFNGNMGVSKTIIAEITDASNRAQALGSMSMVWACGTTIAPIIGGLLSDPAIQYPDTLGRIQLFRRFPYLLPCMVAGAYAATLAILQIVLLNESAPAVVKARQKQAQKHNNTSGSSETAPLLEDNETTSDYGTVPEGTSINIEPKLSISRLFVPDVIKVLINLGFLCLVEGCCTAIFPLVYSTPIKVGGLGLPPRIIGLTLGSFGFFNGFIQIFFFAKLQRWTGVRTMYIVCFSVLGVSIGAYPAMIYLAKRAGRVDGYVWALIALQGICSACVSMAYGCASIFVIETVPSPELLGTANGFAQMVSSGMRVIGPFAASSLFSISLQHNLMGGTLVYWVLLALTALGIRASFLVPKRMRTR